jgi:hypothetical protein
MKLKSLLITMFLSNLHLFGVEPPLDKEQITTALSTFQKQGDAKDLNRAIELLDIQNKGMTTSQRVDTFISFAEKLTLIYDPEFDINPPQIFLNVSPGVGYESGISPADVADKKVRADYERRLSQNIANAKAVRIQTAIRQGLDKLAHLCGVALDSREMSSPDKQKAALAINRSSLPKRFKEYPVLQEAANKALHPTGGAAVPKDAKK